MKKCSNNRWGVSSLGVPPGPKTPSLKTYATPAFPPSLCQSNGRHNKNVLAANWIEPAEFRSRSKSTYSSSFSTRVGPLRFLVAVTGPLRFPLSRMPRQKSRFLLVFTVRYPAASLTVVRRLFRQPNLILLIDHPPTKRGRTIICVEINN